MMFCGAQLQLLIPHFLHRAVILSPSVSQIRTFSSASCSETPSVSDRRFVHVKKFHANKKKQERRVIICIFNRYAFR